MNLPGAIRLLLWTILAVVAGSIIGCESTGRFFEKGGHKARQIVGSIEPTGVVSDTIERKELMKSARTLIESIDAEAINQTVTRLADASAKLLERIEAVPTENVQSSSVDLAESLRALRTQLEAARFDETLASVRTLTASADERISALDVDAANAILSDLKSVASRLNDAVAQLNDASTQALHRIDELGADAQDALRSVPTGDIAKRINVALEGIEETAATLPQSAAKLKQVLSTVEFASRLAVAVLSVLFLCLSAWLYRLLRVRPA